MIVTVTGSRDFVGDARWRFAFLNAITYLLGVLKNDERLIVRHGDCRGADRWCAQQLDGFDSHIVIEPWPADWNRLGRGAGPIRNHEMLDGGSKGRAHILIALPEGPGGGTRGCKRLADSMGITIWELER